MSERKDGEADPKRKPGRFSWVKRLIQPKGNGFSPAKSAEGRKKSQDDLTGAHEVQAHIKNREDVATTETMGNSVETIDTKQPTSSYSKAASIAHESISTRADNVSTLPVISMSTASVRSSTFSDHSTQSTSATMASDHPTLFTNASTIGIAPASIADRRERTHPRSINSHLHITSNNSSLLTLSSSNSGIQN